MVGAAAHGRGSPRRGGDPHHRAGGGTVAAHAGAGFQWLGQDGVEQGGGGGVCAAGGRRHLYRSARRYRDIGSLLAAANAPDELRRRGVGPALAEQFAAAVDVVIFTPGSQAGVPLCADPVDANIAALPLRQRARARALRASEVFLPYWELVLERGGGRGYRVLTFDALVGRPLLWDAARKSSTPAP